MSVCVADDYHCVMQHVILQIPHKSFSIPGSGSSLSWLTGLDVL